MRVQCRPVAASDISGVDDADLGSLEFWGRPAEERDRYFELLGDRELGSAFIHGIQRMPCTFASRA